MNALTVGDLQRAGHLEFSDGYRTNRSELAHSGFRIIRVADVIGGRVSLSGCDFVAGSKRANIGAKVGQAGDILLTTKGTVGRVAVFEGADEEVVYSPQLCFFRVLDSSLIDAKYLRYWFSSDEFLHQSSYRKGNTDMADYINLADIRSLSVTIPALEEQRSIAEVLCALDDKISSNRALMDNLKLLAQQKFRWSIREGWITSTVDGSAVFHNRRRVPLSASERDAAPGVVPYYGASGAFGTVENNIFDEVLCLVGEDGSVVNDDGSPVVQYIWGPSWVNNHAHVLTGREISTELLLLAIECKNVQSLVTGAVQPKISMGNLKKLELELPETSAAIELEREIQPVFGMIRELVDESRRLEDIRSVLLPQLMSGELRVRDAEKAGEKVL